MAIARRIKDKAYELRRDGLGAPAIHKALSREFPEGAPSESTISGWIKQWRQEERSQRQREHGAPLLNLLKEDLIPPSLSPYHGWTLRAGPSKAMPQVESWRSEHDPLFVYLREHLQAENGLWARIERFKNLSATVVVRCAQVVRKEHRDALAAANLPDDSSYPSPCLSWAFAPCLFEAALRLRLTKWGLPLDEPVEQGRKIVWHPYNLAWVDDQDQRGRVRDLWISAVERLARSRTMARLVNLDRELKMLAQEIKGEFNQVVLTAWLPGRCEDCPR